MATYGTITLGTVFRAPTVSEQIHIIIIIVGIAFEDLSPL